MTQSAPSIVRTNLPSNGAEFADVLASTSTSDLTDAGNRACLHGWRGLISLVQKTNEYWGRTNGAVAQAADMAITLLVARAVHSAFVLVRS